MRKPVKKRRQRAPGGGRKPLGKKRMTYKLMPETIESIRRCAREAHQSQSEYVEAAVREKLEAELKRSGEHNQPEKNQGKKLAGETSDSLLPEARDKAKSTSKAGGSPYQKDHKQPQIDAVELLNHLLEQNGLSRKDLAQVLGLDVSGVARILEGTCPITPEHAVRLGERFELRPALFLSLEYRGRRDSGAGAAQRANQQRSGAGKRVYVESLYVAATVSTIIDKRAG